MASTKKVTIEGQKFVLQSVSPTWYFENCDKYGINGESKRNMSGYMDSLLRNCVIEPAGIASQGLEFFDETEDISTPTRLVNEIETFLKEPKQPAGSKKESDGK